MSQSKILLTIIPIFWPKYPPLGLGYLQAYLQSKEIESDIWDLNNYFYNFAGAELKKDWIVASNTFLEKEIMPIIQNQFSNQFQQVISKMLEYDYIGFSCFKSNLENTLYIVRILKNKKPGLKIALGGPEMARQNFASHGHFTEEILQLADYIVVGEGEKNFYEFITNQNQERLTLFAQMDNLEELAYPKFLGVDFSGYPRRDAIPVEFSRGCVRKCNFCSERLLFPGYRTRTVNSMIDEMTYNKKERNIHNFIFFDSMLNGNLPKMEQLLDAIIQNFGSVGWEAQMAVRKDMNISVMEKMKKSGCYNIFIGLESGCNRTLEKMHKGFTAEHAADFFKKMRQAHINFGVSMMVGYPGETWDDFEESLNFVIHNKEWIPKIEQVNPFTYYEGTVADREGDYRLHQESLEKMHIFVEEIKKHNMRYTKAFIGNLIEKAYYDQQIAS